VLSALQSDAKASSAEIADRANLSMPTARKYIRKLESEGVIVGYSADVNPKKLSDQSIALVGVDVASDKYIRVIRKLEALESVQALYTSSGDHPLMAEIRAPDGDSLSTVISDEILGIEGVVSACPAILQERLK
ncbi:MAG: Lrp/AsnC family transcriptional regulator, partial [Halobacteriales archaeon]|nr:Lrp/AsnC family transcriptional regulator [Halobacteriales archaeon]